MSDATAELWTGEGELVGYSIYHGSSDTFGPDFWPTMDEAWDWRHAVKPGDVNPWDRLAACKHDGEDAIVYSDYGGRHWPVKVCRECRVVQGPLSPYPMAYGYSMPPKEEQEREAAFAAAGWPKDGHPFPEKSPYGSAR